MLSPETYITKRRGETGDPWGVLTETGAKTLGEPWKSRQQDLPVRKERVQDTRYGLAPLALSMLQREEGLTLSKSPLMSRKRVQTSLLSICRVLILWVRVEQASATDKPGREPQWWGLRRLVTPGTPERRLFIILSRIFEKV